MQIRLAQYLTATACLWAATIFAAPYAIASHHPALVGAAALVYEGAGLICHQRPERSFHLAGVQLPVCGRCLGLYISGAIGALAAWFTVSRSLSGRARAALLVAALPTAVTVSLEFVGVIHPGNALRAVSALPLGATAAWIFVGALRAEAEAARRAATSARKQPS